MQNINEALKKALKIRDERTVIGAVIGFVVGAFLGMDALPGVLGGTILGWIVYGIYNAEVKDIQKIREMKK